MAEDKWIGIICYVCGFPMKKEDAQNYDMYGKPIHMQDECIKNLRNELEQRKKEVVNIDSGTRTRDIIKEIKKLKEDCEIEISKDISKSIDKFKEKTGLSPSRISVQMIDVSNLYDTIPTYIIGNVELTIEGW